MESMWVIIWRKRMNNSNSLIEQLKMSTEDGNVNDKVILNELKNVRDWRNCRLNKKIVTKKENIIWYKYDFQNMFAKTFDSEKRIYKKDLRNAIPI